jgi:hypothetical protein
MRWQIPRESRCGILFGGASVCARARVCVCVPLFKPDSCSSPRYGQHLNIDQIANIVQAPESEIAAVTSWLRAHNIPHKISATRHIVEAEAPVAAVEALLNCELYVFTNKFEPERSLVRKVGAMYLPHGVANVVSGVFNVVGNCSTNLQNGSSRPLTVSAPSDPPLSRKGAIPRKPHPASPSNLPNSAPQNKPILLPSIPRSAIGQLVSVTGSVFAPGQVLEPSPTAPVQVTRLFCLVTWDVLALAPKSIVCVCAFLFDDRS